MIRVFLTIQGIEACIFVSKFELISASKMTLYDLTGKAHTVDLWYDTNATELAAIELSKNGYCDLRTRVCTNK